MQFKKFFQVSFAAMVLLTGGASAAVRPQLTRIIAYTHDKETPVEIVNDSNDTYMVQSWIEDLQGKDTDIPIVLTPPIMKLDGKKHGKLRLVLMPGNIPRDRESVYWINMQEIPPKAKSVENKMVIAIRSRMKIFVRPEGFNAEGSRKAALQLKWGIVKEGDKTWLKATNASAYYISFGELSIQPNGIKNNRLNDKYLMVPPNGSERYLLPASYKAGKLIVTWSGVHDWGGEGKESKQEISLQ